MNHWLLLLALTLSACSALQQSTQKPAPAAGHAAASISDRELDVIETILRDKFGYIIKRGGKLILRDTTTTDSWPASKLDEDNPRVGSECIHAFNKLNASPVQLPQSLKKRLPIHYLSEAESTAIWGNTSEDGWKQFHRRFPKSGSCISISRVAFSPDGNTAIIYLGQTSDWLAGTGRTHVLRRTFWGWKFEPYSIGPMWMA